MTGLIACAVSPHIPRIAIEEKAPDFQRGMIDGIREMGAAIRAMKPDVIVLVSAHWMCTFNWYVNCHPRHKGFSVADEAPDLVPGLPYDYAGDPLFGQALVEAVAKRDVPILANTCEHYKWDYGCYVPLHYLDPQAGIPTVQMPSVLAASHQEADTVGRMVDEVARAAGRRAVLVASTALAHQVARGPALWPSDDQIAADKEFTGRLLAGDLDAIQAGFAAYCKRVYAEMGGRPLATLLGGAAAMKARMGGLSGRQFGPYTQSSGSGNASLLVTA